LTLLVFGALAGMQGPRIAANLPTPWLGITERVNVYSSMLWVLVLAVVLLREEQRTGRTQEEGAGDGLSAGITFEFDANVGALRREDREPLLVQSISVLEYRLF